MSEKNKIYFLSDVHLGAPALTNNPQREKLLVEWLDFIKDDVKELYLLGDIFDFWFEYKKVVPRGFTRILGRIADLTDKGVNVHFFTGNHDLWVFDYLPAETGVILHKSEYITKIGDKKFYLAHGDDLDPNDLGYKFLKKIFTNRIAQWIFRRLHPNFAFYVAHEWSKSSRLNKTYEKEEFKVKNESMYKFAENFLKQEKIDYFIFGHRHKMVNIEMENQSRLILLGDWITHFSYGVFNENSFELKQFTR